MPCESSLRAPVYKRAFWKIFCEELHASSQFTEGGSKVAFSHHCKNLGFHVNSMKDLGRVTISWEIFMFQSYWSNGNLLGFSLGSNENVCRA